MPAAVGAAGRARAPGGIGLEITVAIAIDGPAAQGGRTTAQRPFGVVRVTHGPVSVASGMLVSRGLAITKSFGLPGRDGYGAGTARGRRIRVQKGRLARIKNPDRAPYAVLMRRQRALSALAGAGWSVQPEFGDRAMV
jgi:hypothetical protein